MKLYTLISDLSDYILFSFNRDDLINKIDIIYSSENLEYFNGESIDDYINQIKEQEIELPECAWILTNWDEWDCTYSLEKYISTTKELKNIEFSKYSVPELHQIYEDSTIDDEPFIFIQ